MCFLFDPFIKLLIDSGAPVDVRNAAGLTALDMADNPDIRAIIIAACACFSPAVQKCNTLRRYSQQRSSGQLKFSSSGTFKTPKEVTLELRALAQHGSKIAANTCGGWRWCRVVLQRLEVVAHCDFVTFEQVPAVKGLLYLCRQRGRRGCSTTGAMLMISACDCGGVRL